MGNSLRPLRQRLLKLGDTTGLIAVGSLLADTGHEEHAPDGWADVLWGLVMSQVGRPTADARRWLLLGAQVQGRVLELTRTRHCDDVLFGLREQGPSGWAEAVAAPPVAFRGPAAPLRERTFATFQVWAEDLAATGGAALPTLVLGNYGEVDRGRPEVTPLVVSGLRHPHPDVAAAAASVAWRFADHPAVVSAAEALRLRTRESSVRQDLDRVVSGRAPSAEPSAAAREPSPAAPAAAPPVRPAYTLGGVPLAPPPPPPPSKG